MRFFLEMGPDNNSHIKNNDTILYSPKMGKLLSYVKNEELFDHYEWEITYVSESGKSSKGYIDSANCDLIKFGYYRIDKKHNQKGEVVGVSNKDKLWGFAPIRQYTGLEDSFPVVITNKKDLVVFCHDYQIAHIIENWGDWDWDFIPKNHYRCTEIPIHAFDAFGFKQERDSVVLHNLWGSPPKVSATRFINWRQERKEVDIARVGEDIYIDENESAFCRFLNLKEAYRVEQDSLNYNKRTIKTQRYLHINKDGYYDTCWDLDSSYQKVDSPRWFDGINPRNIRGEIIDGWIGEGRGLCWKREGLEIKAFIERKLSNFYPEVKDTKWDQWIFFSDTTSVIKWFNKTNLSEDEIRENRIEKFSMELVRVAKNIIASRRKQKAEEEEIRKYGDILLNEYYINSSIVEDEKRPVNTMSLKQLMNYYNKSKLEGPLTINQFLLYNKDILQNEYNIISSLRNIIKKHKKAQRIKKHMNKLKNAYISRFDIERYAKKEESFFGALASHNVLWIANPKQIDGFIRKHHIQLIDEKISLGSLLAHSEINELLTHDAFRRFITAFIIESYRNI